MAESLEGALRERLLPAQPHASGRAAAAAIAELAGEALAGVIFFGSRKSGAGFDARSAHDFFVLTRGYRRFYRALGGAGRLRRSPALLAALNAALPPNQIRLELETGAGRATAKCAVIDAGRFERETGWDRSDHFCLGRMFQPVEIVHAADAGAEERLVASVLSAHRLSYRWIRPWLPASFDADEYYRTLLRVSLSGEIRPESGSRADSLWEAQEEHRRALYPLLLQELEAAGELARVRGGRHALARPAGAWERLRLGAYFQWSRVRATLRWSKYVVTFDDWLDYLLQKVERHGGRVEVTPAQRRHPLLLLWPRLFRFLRERER